MRQCETTKVVGTTDKRLINGCRGCGEAGEGWGSEGESDKQLDGKAHWTVFVHFAECVKPKQHFNTGTHCDQQNAEGACAMYA